MINRAISELMGYHDLSDSLMQDVMEAIMSGKTPTTQIVSFLEALAKKGETVEELTAAAVVMRKYVTKINSQQKLILDTCGTGGDGKETFNISTASAFVASGAGITVAKHGNRAVSSCCGSADILEFMGIDINLGPDKISTCLEKAGIAFLYAANLHPAMKYAAEARRQIGKRTMFNLLGPLTNPAGATHQIIGVYDPAKTEIIARVLANLGTVHALVVCSTDGLDEITTTAETVVSELRAGKISNYQINPRTYFIPMAEMRDLRATSLLENQRIMLGVLQGVRGAQRDIVVLNAAAAIYAADKASSIEEGVRLATQSIDSGEALRKLELLKRYSI